MSSLRDRLSSAEEDYLTALISGEDAMIAFGTRWEAILADIDAALESTGLDSGTITLAHTTSLRLATLADTSAELFDSYNSLTSQLMAQLDQCMSALTLDDSSETSLSDCDHSPLQSHRSCLSLSSPNHGASNPSKHRLSSTEEIVKRPRFNMEVVAHPTRKLRRSRPHLPSNVPATTSHLDLSAVATPPVTRKRRLSDAASSTLVGAKRFCAGPRLHAVSDTYATLYSSKGVTAIPTSPIQAGIHGLCPHPNVPIHPETLDPVTLHVHSLPCTGSPGGSDAGELFATAPLNVFPPGNNDLDVFPDSFFRFGTSSMIHASPVPHSPSVRVLESLLPCELYSDSPDQVGSPCDTSTAASSPSSPLTPPLFSPGSYTPPKYEIAHPDFNDAVDISSMLNIVSDSGGISPLAPKPGQDWCRVLRPGSSEGVHIVHTDGAAANPFDSLWHAFPLAYWGSGTSEVSEAFGEVILV